MTVRTHCGTIVEGKVGEQVLIRGWVQKRRDLGQVIFLDVRDRSGIVQVVFSQETSQEALAIAEKIRNEYVLEIEGTQLIMRL